MQNIVMASIQEYLRKDNKKTTLIFGHDKPRIISFNNKYYTQQITDIVEKIGK